MAGELETYVEEVLRMRVSLSDALDNFETGAGISQRDVNLLTVGLLQEVGGVLKRLAREIDALKAGNA